MSKKLFTDALNDETIVKLTDEMLKQNNLNKSRKKYKFEFIKIIPAVAAIVLVFTLINILPNLLSSDVVTPGSQAGINISGSETEKIKMLNGTNTDIYGWIKVNGTTIDYPVVQADDDNEFYLTRDFNKQENRAGAIFCDYRNSRDILENRNLIIYGHNMLDGSRFADLLKYEKDKELFDNGIIELYTEDTVYYYEIFSVSEEDPASGYIQMDFGSDEEYIEFLNAIKERSVFQKDVVLDENSKIITLSTCKNYWLADSRFAVRGVLVDFEKITAEMDVIEAVTDEQEYYTYDEYIAYDKEQREFCLTMIDYTGENWIPISGYPVLTQEIFDEQKINYDANLQKILEDIQNGMKIPKQPSPYNPYAAVYETLEPHLDLKCGIDKNGNWVLYNYDGTSDIMESFGTKDEMLDRARWWLSRGTMAGEVDMAQANSVYRSLYFADAAAVEVLPDPKDGDNIAMPIPVPSPDSAMIQLAYERGYRDSTDYTRFADSAFLQRINNNSISENESKYIYNTICAGDSLALADDITGMNTYDAGDSGHMGVMLELEGGNIVKFEIAIPGITVTPQEEIQVNIDNETQTIWDEIIKLSKKLRLEDKSYEEYTGVEMIWPLDIEYNIISSGFGGRISPVTGQTEYHNGLDIPADYGSNIYAVNDGTVLIAKYGAIYGNYIVIDHGGGITTLYGHASSLLKEAGDKVKRGDIIAKAGSTGYSTGNHLYFEYDEYGTPKNIEYNIISNSIILKYNDNLRRLVDINPDFYGWIKVSNTTIDYPVVQTTDNNYYLAYSFEKKRSNSGAIFADYRNSKNISENRNTVIYGHNMLDNSMFQPLIDFGAREDYFKNGIIEIIREEAVYKYEVFAAYEEAMTEPLTDIMGYDEMALEFGSDEEYVEYLHEKQNFSIFHKDVKLDENSKIITLVTRVNNVSLAHRFVVQGVLVEVR